MRLRSGHVLRFVSPFRATGQRFALVVLVVTGIALMVVGRADPRGMAGLRTQVVDTLAPLLNLLSQPAATVADLTREIEEMSSLRADNARLRQENRMLLHQQIEARRIAAENRALRGLLKMVPDSPVSYISGRVVADPGGSFVHSLLVNAGLSDGVRKGQAVLSGDGLVGRVTDVGQNSARILLLTDLNSRIPVLVERTRDRAILEGDNSGRPFLAFLPANVAVLPGDRVVTSGHGGAFPPGIPVGVVVSDADGAPRVQPFVNFNRLEYVRVVDYGLNGILPPEDGTQAPARAPARAPLPVAASPASPASGGVPAQAPQVKK